MGRTPEDPPPSAPEWLVTFSDLVSLLVTLFIMMLTFSTQETHELAKAMDLIKGSFGMLRHEIRDAPELVKNPWQADNVKDGVTKPQEEDTLEVQLQALVGPVVASNELDGGVRIVIDLPSSFAPGDDRPSAELSEELRRLGRLLRRHAGRSVRIEGHSDASSDRASPVGDLDSLALARAQRAARLLGLEGVPYEQMVVVSKGMRVPRGDTWSEAGQARNRRIDIVVRPLETSKR